MDSQDRDYITGTLRRAMYVAISAAILAYIIFPGIPIAIVKHFDDYTKHKHSKMIDLSLGIAFYPHIIVSDRCDILYDWYKWQIEVLYGR